MKIKFEDIAIVQGLALVKLYKPRTRTEKQTVMDDEKNKGKDPKKDIMALKTVETKVMYNVQTVKVLVIDPLNGQHFAVDDIVLIDARKLKEFDLYKGVNICNIYDIIGKINII